jgi:O-antigen ligase
MLIVFFALEYIRPAGIVQLKLQMLISLALPVMWLTSSRPWNPVMTGQVAFLAWCAKAVPFAWNYYAAYFVTRIMFAHVAIALAVTSFCVDLKSFKRVLWFWLVTILYQALWALTHGGKGSGGFIGDENDLAIACVTLFPLAFFGFDKLSGRARWLCAIGVALLVSATVASFSRGGFVGLMAAAVYCFLASKNKLKVVVVTVVAGFLVASLAPREYIDELQSIQETDSGTAHSRMFLWTAAFNMWKDRPLIGWGGGNTTYMVGAYQPTDWEDKKYQETDWSGTTVHSAYFQLLPEQGLVGLGLFGFLAVFQLRQMRKLRRAIRSSRSVSRSLVRDAEVYSYALNGMLIAYLATAVFISVAYYPYFWYITAFAMALNQAVRNEARAQRLARQPREAQ